jgi:hypothetical protein
MVTRHPHRVPAFGVAFLTWIPGAELGDLAVKSLKP